MIKPLRWISLIEGISFLLLLGIGMPLKYGFDMPGPNKFLGMTHGMLTLVFCTVLYIVWQKKTLNGRWCTGIFIASLIPFGAFVAEYKIKQKFQSA